jgi:hypothetical protein
MAGKMQLGAKIIFTPLRRVPKKSIFATVKVFHTAFGFRWPRSMERGIYGEALQRKAAKVAFGRCEAQIPKCALGEQI